MLKWTDACATGVPKLDAQHRVLFDILNELEASLAAGPDAAARDFPDVVGKLRSYARAHFVAEELCMIANRCEAREANAGAHQDFLDTVSQTEQRLAAEGSSVELASHVHDYVAGWIMSHMMGVDTKLKGCVERFQAANKAGPQLA